MTKIKSLNDKNNIVSIKRKEEYEKLEKLGIELNLKLKDNRGEGDCLFICIEKATDDKKNDLEIRKEI